MAADNYAVIFFMVTNYKKQKNKHNTYIKYQLDNKF